MTLEIGYHMMSSDAVASHDTFEKMSIIEFLRRIKRHKELPLDVTTTGFDTYLEVSRDPTSAAEYVHTVLRDRVNFVFNQSPVVQFVVDEIEHWDGTGPVIPVGEDHVRLVDIFGGSFAQEGPGWWAGEFNVQS
jgi:hypothetical protein